LFLALSEDSLQAFFFDGYSGAGSLGHLLRHFLPVHGHDLSILQPDFWLNIFRPGGALLYSTFSHGLRRGLYSFAASRLGLMVPCGA
jgi:hypothetical protein